MRCMSVAEDYIKFWATYGVTKTGLWAIQNPMDAAAYTMAMSHPVVDDRGAPIVENVGGAPKIVGRGFIREYVFYTTQPISNETLTSTIFNTSSPVPPFMGLGNLDGSQLVAGYGRPSVWTN